jgi:RNase H-fold protein (predicted Holliday junction resolvase)
MSVLGEKTVLAIDPGSSKYGLALVHRNAIGELSLLWKTVCQTEELEANLQTARDQATFNLVIVGNGTKSRPTVERINKFSPGLGVLVVDERETSLQAREKYWELNPRRGWRRLLPSSLQVPPVPVDDYVAVILAERVLGEA